MKLYKQGSRGKKVEQIQRKLKSLRLYDGAIDGIFGLATESAVKAFQREKDLQVDGIVGPKTWEKLFSKEKFKQTLAYRCLALTGSFETGEPPPACFSGLSGNFDDQGISVGCLQWNLGQKTLQLLLNEMLEHHPDVMDKIFKDKLSELRAVLNSKQNEQMEWAWSIQDNNDVEEPWKRMFTHLGEQNAFQQIQLQAAHHRFERAVDLVKEYNLQAERGVALMFDIKVQNGSISDHTKKQIVQDIDELPDWSNGEAARMCIIANRCAEASSQRWIEDARRRKLTIAIGCGSVHGLHYVLDEEYGISLEKTI